MLFDIINGWVFLTHSKIENTASRLLLLRFLPGLKQIVSIRLYNGETYGCIDPSHVLVAVHRFKYLCFNHTVLVSVCVLGWGSNLHVINVELIFLERCALYAVYVHVYNIKCPLFGHFLLP